MGDASSTHRGYDLVVIGAGWYGLGAAKAYIQLHPHERILVLESESSCGGTWSKDRLYPGLKSNNLWGSYEFPDFPMREDVYGVGEGQHIPAAVLHRYLTDYAREFGILERTRFQTRVETVEATANDEWLVYVESRDGGGGGQRETIATRKLIVATGLTSEPNMPSYPGEETFTSPLFHAKEFCARADSLQTCQRAVVVGAGKSAFDVAYAFATDGAAQVDLIIRPTGQGPVWICPPYVTPLKRKMEELLSTRAMTFMSPCPWQGEDGFSVAHGFLHKTALGRWIVQNFWAQISGEVVAAHGYNDDAEVFKLKPWNSAMWTGSGVGIHNYPTNFFTLVSQGTIRVHIADIARLEGDTVHLTNGTQVPTDVVVCATGWKKTSGGLKYQNFDAGLPYPSEEIARRARDADKQVLDMFPALKDQPVLRFDRKPDEQPLRNYRFIVPSSAVPRRNIAYAGMVSTVFTSVFSAVQGLWISAFFDGKLHRPPPCTADEVTDEIMLHTQFGKWRYPCGYGASLPDFAFDSLPYVDLLVNDLGLRNQRKSSPILELLEAYKPKDYNGLAGEWIEKYGKK